MEEVLSKPSYAELLATRNYWGGEGDNSSSSVAIDTLFHIPGDSLIPIHLRAAIIGLGVLPEKVGDNGEVAKWLRPLLALSEDLSLVPTIHVV